MLKILSDLHELHCMSVCVSRINAFYTYFCHFCVPLLIAVLQTLSQFYTPRQLVFLSRLLNPISFPTLKQQCSSMCPPPPVVSSPPPCSSPVALSSLQLCPVYCHCLFHCHFTLNVANVKLGQSSQGTFTQCSCSLLYCE